MDSNFQEITNNYDHIKTPMNAVVTASYRKKKADGSVNIENYQTYGYLDFLKDDLGRNIIPAFNGEETSFVTMTSYCYVDTSNGVRDLEQILFVQQAVIFNDFVLTDFNYQ